MIEKKKRGRPSGSVARYTPQALRSVWVGIESLRRTDRTLGYVDDACGAFARRGFVEYHPDSGKSGVFWASNDPMPGMVGRVVAVLKRTHVKPKPQEDAAESFRKMYDAANKLRRRDTAFRATCDSLLRLALVEHFHREKITDDATSPEDAAALVNATPEQLRSILAHYPEPKKFRIRRRAPR